MNSIKKGVCINQRYTLQEYKGSGSFGEVWRATDGILGQDVAIKLYISLDENGIDEFKREYLNTLGLSHPNLLTITYFDVWQHRPFLVMNYLANGSSSAQAGKMDEYTLWKFIRDVSAGLAHLHSQPEPIIHQDIKPDNILVDDKQNFVITDFGISKKIRSTLRKQSQRAIGAGATAYMAPERFKSNPTPIMASDIWALGASVYELATGELPFNGMGGGMQNAGAALPELPQPAWSQDLHMVMQDCLAKETWNRPTAEQLMRFADAILAGREAEPEWKKQTGGGGTSPKPDKGKRKRILAWVIGLAACCLVALAIGKCQGNTATTEKVPMDTVVQVTDTTTVEVPVDTVVTEEPVVVDSPQPPAATPKEEQKTEPKTDARKAELDAAITRGDYNTVLRLAQQGYAAAYAPLAKHYLNQRDYDQAEAYAKKAQAAGYKAEGAEVINTLQALGYYD